MNEFAFIQRIRERAAQSRVKTAELSLGIGDDTAVFRPQPNRELLITTDLLVEEIDFKLDYTVPRWLGHKALAVSLSDIAAMGGTPRYALLTLAIPRSSLGTPLSEMFWEEFFTGYLALAESCGVVLIGGDLSSTPQGLALDSIVIGDCQAGRAVRRKGARIGDGIYVTGGLGASTAGLRLLLQGEHIREGETTLRQRALRAHLRPVARVEFGRRLGESGLARAMIDVSDGLAQDLGHLCQASEVSAVLNYEAIPVAEEVRLIATNEAEVFQLAAGGGEDFELLFTASRDVEAELQELAQACALPLTRIGEVLSAQAAGRVLLRQDGKLEPLAIPGYDHFAV